MKPIYPFTNLSHTSNEKSISQHLNPKISLPLQQVMTQWNLSKNKA